jgi:hypothetical protein
MYIYIYLYFGFEQMVSDKWATVLATSMFIVIRFATSLIESSRMLVNKKTQPYHGEG